MPSRSEPLLRPDADAAPPAAAAASSSSPPLLGTGDTLLQIFRLYCGTGLLAFPFAVKCGGLVAAPVALLVIGALNNYTLRMLVHSKRRVTSRLPPPGGHVDGGGAVRATGGEGPAATVAVPASPISLDDLAFAAFGAAGRRFCAVAMVVSLLGLCSGYLIFVGSTTRSAFGDPSWATISLFSSGGGDGGGHNLEVNLFTVIATVVVLPLTLIRDYASVKWSGLLGNVSLVAAVGVVSYHIVVHAYASRQPPSSSSHHHNDSSTSISRPAPAPAPVPAPAPAPWAPPVLQDIALDTLPVFLGLVFFAFAFHGVILGVDSVTADPKRFTRNLDIGAVLGVGTYMAFGALSYYAYGSDTAQIIFQSVTQSDPGALDLRAVEVLFCLSMVLLYPLQILPVVQIFERWLSIVNPTMPARRGLGNERRVGTAFSPLQTPAIGLLGGSGGGPSRGGPGGMDAVYTRTSRSTASSPAGGWSSSDVVGGGNFMALPPPAAAALGGRQDNDTSTDQVLRARVVRRGGGGCCCCCCSSLAQQNALRLGLTLVSGGLAVVFGEVFSQIISIVGALGFSLLSFVLPPAIYLKLFGSDLPLWDRALSVAILGVGVGGLIVSTWVDGKSIVQYFEGDTTDPCN